MRLPPAPAPVPEKKRVPLEADVESKSMRYAKSLGYWHRKFVSPKARAEPDRILKIRGYPFFFIEFKRPGKKRTFPCDEHERAQLRAHERIREAGGEVYVMDDVEETKALLREIKEKAETKVLLREIKERIERNAQ